MCEYRYPPADCMRMHTTADLCHSQGKLFEKTGTRGRCDEAENIDERHGLCGSARGILTNVRTNNYVHTKIHANMQTHRKTNIMLGESCT